MRREMKGLGFLETAHRDDRAQMTAWVRAGQRGEPRTAGPATGVLDRGGVSLGPLEHSPFSCKVHWLPQKDETKTGGKGWCLVGRGTKPSPRSQPPPHMPIPLFPYRKESP